MGKLITFDENLYKLHMNPFRFCFTKEEFDVEQFVKDALDIMARPELNDKALTNLLQSSIAWVVGQPLPVVQEMMQSPDGLKEVSERIEDVVSSSGTISHVTEDLDGDSKSVTTSQINDSMIETGDDESSGPLVPNHILPEDPWEVNRTGDFGDKRDEDDGTSSSDEVTSRSGDDGANHDDVSSSDREKEDNDTSRGLDNGKENLKRE